MFDLRNIQTFLQGVNRFYANFERREIKRKIIWQEGSTEVIDYSFNPNKELPVLFLVPSLINKSYILDLASDFSFIGYFVSLGYRVYLVNFCEPIESEFNMGFVDYQIRLSRALRDLRQEDKIITMGYCLGGLFSCSLSGVNILAQVLIATPWSFKHFSNILGLNDPVILNQLMSIVETLEKVSPTLVQWFFSALDPYKIWNKFFSFSSMDQDIEKFIAIEQWINDGISLSKKFALEALDLLKKDDLASKGFFQMNKDIPTLFIMGEEDKIVPPESCEDLVKFFVNKKTVIKKTGHIGLIVSRLAKEQIWPEIETFLRSF